MRLILSFPPQGLFSVPLRPPSQQSPRRLLHIPPQGPHHRYLASPRSRRRYIAEALHTALGGWRTAAWSNLKVSVAAPGGSASAQSFVCPYSQPPNPPLNPATGSGGGKRDVRGPPLWVTTARSGSTAVTCKAFQDQPQAGSAIEQPEPIRVFLSERATR